LFLNLKENIKLIKKNLIKGIRNKKIKVLKKAVWEKDGEIIFRVDKNSLGKKDFGMIPGSKEILLESVSWNRILKKRWDIAKVDCEGGEKFLLKEKNETLRKIPSWIIETHNLKIKKRVIQKFKSAGFSLLKKEKLGKGIHLLTFKLK